MFTTSIGLVFFSFFKSPSVSCKMTETPQGRGPAFTTLNASNLEWNNTTEHNGSFLNFTSQIVFQGLDSSLLDFLNSLLDPKNLLPVPLPDYLTVTFIVLYTMIIGLAVIGNVIVILVIGKQRYIRSVTDLYILSLAVSDLLIATLNMPFQLYFVIANEWLAEGATGEALCKFTNYVQGVTIVACVLTLTAIAIDRYIVICHPSISRKVHNKRIVTICIVAVWVFALCVLVPHLVFQKLDMRLKVSENKQITGTGWICAEFYPRGKKDAQLYSIFVYIALYCFPLLIMVYTYGAIAHRLWFRRQVFPAPGNTTQLASSVAQKKKITKLLISLVLAFAILWLPFFTFSMYCEFLDEIDSSNRLKMAVLQLVGYANCCVNPIIYTFLNQNFQREFKRICSCRCRNAVSVFKTETSESRV